MKKRNTKTKSTGSTTSKKHFKVKSKRKAKVAPLTYNLVAKRGDDYCLAVNINDGKVLVTFSGTVEAINDAVKGLHSGVGNVMEMVRQIVPQLAPQQAPAPAPNWDETAKAWNALTPEQQAAAKADAPKGMQAVVESLNAVQTKRFRTVFEYQGLVEYMLQEMSDEFREAVIKGDGGSVISLLSEAMDGSPHRELLADWFAKPDVAAWIGEYTAQLAPSVEAWVAAHPKPAAPAAPKAKTKRRGKSRNKAGLSRAAITETLANATEA